MPESKPDWFQAHELSDSERHGQVLGAIGQLDTSVKNLAASVEQVTDRQWESKRPGLKGQGTTVLLIGVISALVNLLGHFADRAFPAPATATPAIERSHTP